ncbi:PREDICTED: cell growth-regulating nucleolar protein [Diuraphis noxia]|uniref:cell growth-regulating nucleolar protein n=1 Tax=Diuraphis noxia TaxID=143948 RepID=UPI00076364A5|nr:PREDICTED: cell growth-regulating nucleolar protein [Diuraphis noxia]
MVVFTCNNCGDSVNKPKVEKHIQYECKRKNFAVSFCCVDCLKDFNYETVKDHCQCVTEDQRYAAKGYVPKPSAEKGKRKQAGWVDIVQSVMNNKNLPNEQRQFLNIIAKFDNVPRKKNKFQINTMRDCILYFLIVKKLKYCYYFSDKKPSITIVNL